MTSEHLRAQPSEPPQASADQASAAQPEAAQTETVQPEAVHSDAAQPAAAKPSVVGVGRPRRVLAPQAPSALGGMGSTGPITVVRKKR